MAAKTISWVENFIHNGNGFRRWLAWQTVGAGCFVNELFVLINFHTICFVRFRCMKVIVIRSCKNLRGWHQNNALPCLELSAKRPPQKNFLVSVGSTTNRQINLHQSIWLIPSERFNKCLRWPKHRLQFCSHQEIIKSRMESFCAKAYSVAVADPGNFWFIASKISPLVTSKEKCMFLVIKKFAFFSLTFVYAVKQ